MKNIILPIMFLSATMVIGQPEHAVVKEKKEKMEMMMAWKLTEHLKLTNEEAEKFFPRFREHREIINTFTDKEKILRTVIATMQDLGFIIDKADLTLGSVSGTKLAGYSLRLTVSVRPRGESQLLVRANAQYNIQAVEKAKPYQDFFTSLAKAMFLTAHAVE